MQTHTELNPERNYVQLGVNNSFARNPDNWEDEKVGVGMIRELKVSGIAQTLSGTGNFQLRNSNHRDLRPYGYDCNLQRGHTTSFY